MLNLCREQAGIGITQALPKPALSSLWVIWLKVAELLARAARHGYLNFTFLMHLRVHREYANFRVSSDGEVQGVGLLIAADPTSGKLVVLAPIQGGPADRAGIQSGDEVCTTFPSLGAQPELTVVKGGAGLYTALYWMWPSPHV